MSKCKDYAQVNKIKFQLKTEKYWGKCDNMQISEKKKTGKKNQIQWNQYPGGKSDSL